LDALDLEEVESCAAKVRVEPHGNEKEHALGEPTNEVLNCIEQMIGKQDLLSPR
jgi:hypothetical protein